MNKDPIPLRTPHETPRPWRKALVVTLLACALVATVLALRESAAHTSGLAAALAQRGRVVVLDGSPWRARSLPGTEFVAPSPAVLVALEADASGGRADALAVALDEMLAWGLLVESSGPTEDRSALARLATYQRTPPLRAQFLTESEVLYTRDLDSADAIPEGDLLARVARAILEGRSPPPIGLFPEPLRRMRSVEVMVLLRAQGTPRLWRSARGSSIARALITACMVARERWHERAQALGGPLDGQLAHLDVEVALLHEDGTLAEASPHFIERVFTPVHGVAYERTRSWRYYLPDATRERGQGSAVGAYQALLVENGQGPEALGEAQLRLYRLVVTSLGRSAAPFGDGSLEASLPGLVAPASAGASGPDPAAAAGSTGDAEADSADLDALLPPGEWLGELEEVAPFAEPSPAP